MRCKIGRNAVDDDDPNHYLSDVDRSTTGNIIASNPQGVMISLFRACVCIHLKVIRVKALRAAEPRLLVCYEFAMYLCFSALRNRFAMNGASHGFVK